MLTDDLPDMDDIPEGGNQATCYDDASLAKRIPPEDDGAPDGNKGSDQADDHNGASLPDKIPPEEDGAPENSEAETEHSEEDSLLAKKQQRN